MESARLFLLRSLGPLSFSSLPLPFPSSLPLLISGASAGKPDDSQRAPVPQVDGNIPDTGPPTSSCHVETRERLMTEKQHAPAKVRLEYRAELPAWLCRIPDDFLLLTLERGSHSRVLL